MFPKQGYPQIIHFNGVFHYKPSILGYPYFLETPICMERRCSKHESRIISIYVQRSICMLAFEFGYGLYFKIHQRDMEGRSTISSCVWPSLKSIESEPCPLTHVLMHDLWPVSLSTPPDYRPRPAAGEPCGNSGGAIYGWRISWDFMAGVKRTWKELPQMCFFCWGF